MHHCSCDREEDLLLRIHWNNKHYDSFKLSYPVLWILKAVLILEPSNLTDAIPLYLNCLLLTYYLHVQ